MYLSSVETSESSPPDNRCYAIRLAKTAIVSVDRCKKDLGIGSSVRTTPYLEQVVISSA